MTTATTEGRRLVLTVEGIDDPFVVDPLAAARGRRLTERFIAGSLGQLDPLEVASIFAESIGPANYSRLTGNWVDEYADDGEHVARYNPSGPISMTEPPARPEGTTARYISVDADGAFDGEAIRQAEGETLCLAAFYWQTVVGIEGVNALLEDDGGTGGSLKAMNLLLFRLGVSPSTTSHSGGLGNLTSQVDIPGMSTPSGSGTLARLPLGKRGHKPAGNRATKRSRRKR